MKVLLSDKKKTAYSSKEFIVDEQLLHLGIMVLAVPKSQFQVSVPVPLIIQPSILKAVALLVASK